MENSTQHAARSTQQIADRQQQAEPVTHSLNSHDTLAELAAVIESRKPRADGQGGDPDKSYVARLFAKGTDAILKKIGEEATEVVLAAKDGDRARVVAEVADLWFHTLVALAHLDLKPEDVLAELRRREGVSGLQEFAQRSLAPASLPKP
jgi:phosphoribosyl-ATP pyrophosphohydrolase